MASADSDAESTASSSYSFSTMDTTDTAFSFSSGSSSALPTGATFPFNATQTNQFTKKRDVDKALSWLCHYAMEFAKTPAKETPRPDPAWAFNILRKLPVDAEKPYCANPLRDAMDGHFAEIVNVFARSENAVARDVGKQLWGMRRAVDSPNPWHAMYSNPTAMLRLQQPLHGGEEGFVQHYLSPDMRPGAAQDFKELLAAARVHFRDAGYEDLLEYYTASVAALRRASTGASGVEMEERRGATSLRDFLLQNAPGAEGRQRLMQKFATGSLEMALRAEPKQKIPCTYAYCKTHAMVTLTVAAMCAAGSQHIADGKARFELDGAISHAFASDANSDVQSPGNVEPRPRQKDAPLPMRCSIRETMKGLEEHDPTKEEETNPLENNEARSVLLGKLAEMEKNDLTPKGIPVESGRPVQAHWLPSPEAEAAAVSRTIELCMWALEHDVPGDGKAFLRKANNRSTLQQHLTGNVTEGAAFLPLWLLPKVLETIMAAEDGGWKQDPMNTNAVKVAMLYAAKVTAWTAAHDRLFSMPEMLYHYLVARRCAAGIEAAQKSGDGANMYVQKYEEGVTLTVDGDEKKLLEYVEGALVLLAGKEKPLDNAAKFVCE